MGRWRRAEVPGHRQEGVGRGRDLHPREPDHDVGLAEVAVVLLGAPDALPGHHLQHVLLDALAGDGGRVVIALLALLAYFALMLLLGWQAERGREHMHASFYCGLRTADCGLEGR